MIRKILHRPQAVIGLAMMLTVIAAVIFAPLLAPNDPDKLDILHKFADPSEKYPLGTDDMGRCIMSRLIYGARSSIGIAFPAIGALAVISTMLATVCAYIGGTADRIFAVISNIFMALPPFLVAMTLVGAFESKAVGIVFSIVMAMWVCNAQVVRTYVLREKSKPYIITCRMSGCTETRIVLRHIVPNILPHLLVLYSTGLSSVIIMISSYAFLGLGLETGTAEWGAMLVNADKLIYSHPEMLVYPGLCILFAAAGFNLFGEALRDICDPRGDVKMLEVNNLEIHSKSTGETLVKSVSFSVGPGETLGLIGESGSGKSMTSKCIIRLLDPGLFDMTGSIRWKGAEILTKKSGAPKGYRGRQVGMITQNPMTAFAPMIKLGKQLEMGFDLKGRAARRELYDRFDTALTGVNLHDTKKILNSYPDELSGGMLQRVMIALTMMQKPELLIADECTTAVDAASKYLILGELENMAKLYFDNMRPTLGMSANYGQLDMLITEITADDEYTVSFHLARPYYNVLNDLSMVMPRGILSAAAFNEDGSTNDEYLMTHTPGTGPYMFESVNDTATEYTFVRNPYYWGEAPDVDRFKVVIIPESKVAAMRSGNVDFIIGSETLDAESYKELSAADGITGIVSDFDFVTEFIALNDDIAGLDDINVRTAIQMALDKNAVAESIYSGLRTAADSVMPADMPLCKYDVTCPGYDPEGAVKLLDDNGWLDSDGNGIRDKDGTELSFTITYPATGVYDNVVLYYQATMQELGIEVKTEPLDLMTFFNQIFSEVKYDMTAYMSYWFPYDPYTFVANMYPSTDYMAADGIYSTDPQVAKAIATMNEEDAKTLIAGLYQYDDSAKIQEIYTKALNSANESSVIIPLNYRNEYAVFNSDKIASYTFNSIPNHVDVAAMELK